MSTIARTSCRIVPRPLKEPFRTSLRTVSSFDVIEFSIETEEGISAIGEAVETPAITGDSQEMILDGLLGPIRDALEGISFSSPLELAERVSSTSAVASAKAAADMALYFLKAVYDGETLAESMDCSSTSVATDVTIPVADRSEIPDLVRTRLAEGFNWLKVKLSMEPVENSVEKMKLIYDVCDGKCIIRIDPNQAWTISHTLRFLEALDEAGISIDYLEQPTPAKNIKALAEIRRNTEIPIMVDESCFDMQDLLQIIEFGAADLVNLKLLKSGGVTPVLKLAEVAKQAGLDVRVGSMMEGDLGVYAAACLANTFAPTAVHDLDASWWARSSRINYSAGQVTLL